METAYLWDVTEDNEIIYTNEDEGLIKHTIERLAECIAVTFKAEFQDALFYARYLTRLAIDMFLSGDLECLEDYEIELMKDQSEYNKAFDEATITKESSYEN